MAHLVKIGRKLKEKGIVGLLRYVIGHLRLVVLPYCDYWFDFKHKVDTCGVVFHGSASDIDGEERKTAVRYEATPVSVVRAILEDLPIDYSEYTFIDFGSGKGRVILLASRYPFKRVLGVELSKRLHEIAEKNLKTHRRLEQRCTNVMSVCMNATRFDLPEDPLVLFFFTPFLGSVMKSVVDRLQKSLEARPRSVYIAYYGSRADILEILSGLNFDYREIDLKQPFSASGHYKGHLFSSRTHRLG